MRIGRAFLFFGRENHSHGAGTVIRKGAINYTAMHKVAHQILFYDSARQGQKIPFRQYPDSLLYGAVHFGLPNLFVYSHKDIQDKGVNIAGGKEYFVEEYKKLGKVTLVEKKAAISLLFLFLFILTSSWHGLDTLFGFIAAVVYLFLPGINVGKKEAVTKVNMGTIAFMVACCSIGTVGSSLGFDQLVTDLLSSLLQDADVYTVSYTIFGMGIIGKLVMAPLALINCLAAPLAQLGADLGMNPLGPINTLLLSTDMYVMPYQNSWTMAFFAMGMFRFKEDRKSVV